ncbi:NAD-dependent epimerase/dehydratase family protein [Veronia pacifica]|uniref:NAD-dependent epimerase/dehydratase domain-containing protein n=1 Tax=Veronia pacifica TaxID=1080227 RepID=A0A1C3ESM1_9GAMM|nr:NAD-dependent epimerase/dehydratase family protein [Veronia pacifica]ODA36205.1 hypothetical protein A8L45_00965 [Veronia pacifica]
MKVLVAGSRGYIGRHIVSTFIEHDVDVFTFQRECSSTKPSDKNVIAGDLSLRGSFDIVINCARPHWSNYSPVEIAEIERKLLVELDTFASENAVKIHTSGTWLFGHANSEEARQFEHKPFHMVEPDKKTIADILSRNWHIVYLPSLVYGGQSCQLKRILDELPESSLTIATPSVGFNQYVHVTDVARFYLTLPTQTTSSVRQHFIAEQGGFSPEDFASLLQRSQAVQDIKKVSWDEFRAVNGEDACDVERFNLTVPVSAQFIQTCSVRHYIEQNLVNYTQKTNQ